MTNHSGKTMVTMFFLPILWIFGLIIFGISIAGILEAQSLFEVHSFVVVLIFIIFMGILSAVRMALQKKMGSSFNYNVEEGVSVEEGAKDRVAGKENKAYDTLEKKGTSSKDAAAKWVNSYVPYGEYPKGNEVGRPQDAHLNGTTVQVSEGDEIDFKEAKCEEEEDIPEDSNKIPEDSNKLPEDSTKIPEDSNKIEEEVDSNKQQE